MRISNENYKVMVSKHSRKSPILRDCVLAFLFGGALCAVGQGIHFLWESGPFTEEMVGILTSVSLIFLGVFLTGLGVYDWLAKFGGAGTLIPITGFANSVAAPIMEFRDEGMILGIGTKFFVIAGPVISYGIISSVLYGLVFYICALFK